MAAERINLINSSPFADILEIELPTSPFSPCAVGDRSTALVGKHALLLERQKHMASQPLLGNSIPAHAGRGAVCMHLTLQCVMNY